MCNYGEVIYWDDWCMFYSSTTTPPPTTIPFTTTPLAPPGGCVYENKVYFDGNYLLTSYLNSMLTIKAPEYRHQNLNLQKIKKTKKRFIKTML